MEDEVDKREREEWWWWSVVGSVWWVVGSRTGSVRKW